MATPADPHMPLAQDERAELIRLRRQATTWIRPRHRGRWVGAILLVVLAGLLAIASVSAVFLRQELLDTQRYVATVAPLAHEPALREAVADVLTDEIVTRLELSDRLHQLAGEAEELGAPELLDALVAPATDGVRSFLRDELRAILASDEFAQVWEAANRVAHDELAALLTTGRGEFLEVQGEEIYLDLGAIVEMVRERLIAAGFGLAEEIPQDLAISYPILHADQLPELQTATWLLDQAAWVLPLLTGVLLVAGVLVAPVRRRGLVAAAIALGLAALLALAALALARTYFLDHLPASTPSRAAAEELFDTLLRFYREALRTLVTLAAVVAVTGWLAGPGRVPVTMRRWVGRGLDLAAHGLARMGLRGPAPGFVAGNRQVIEVAVVIVAVAVLVIWRWPGVDGTLWLTAGSLAVLAVVELVARAAATATGPQRP